MLPPDEEGIAYADIDLDFIEIANYFFDPVGHYARPDVFDVRIDRRRQAAFREITDGAVRPGYPELDEEATSTSHTTSATN